MLKPFPFTEAEQNVKRRPVDQMRASAIRSTPKLLNRLERSPALVVASRGRFSVQRKSFWTAAEMEGAESTSFPSSFPTPSPE